MRRRAASASPVTMRGEPISLEEDKAVRRVGGGTRSRRGYTIPSPAGSASQTHESASPHISGMSRRGHHRRSAPAGWVWPRASASCHLTNSTPAQARSTFVGNRVLYMKQIVVNNCLFLFFDFLLLVVGLMASLKGMELSVGE